MKMKTISEEIYVIVLQYIGTMWQVTPHFPQFQAHWCTKISISRYGHLPGAEPYILVSLETSIGSKTARIKMEEHAALSLRFFHLLFRLHGVPDCLHYFAVVGGPSVSICVYVIFWCHI